MAFGVFWGLVSLVFAGYVVKDAGQRGMSGAGWGIATFFLMIPVFPIYCLIRKPLH